MTTRSFSDDTSRRAQFEAELLPHLDAVYRTALRLTRAPSDAEDLVQDTVLKAYRFFDRFEAGTNARAWLLKIMTNLFFSRYRRSSLEAEVRTLGASDPVADGWIGMATMEPRREPGRAAEGRLMQAAVAKALEEVPEDFRTVLILVDIEGLTYREVAETLGCPIGTVMSRLHRGRRAVGERLGVTAHGAPAETAADPVVSLEQYRRRREGAG